MKIISVTLSRVFTIALLGVSTLAYGQAANSRSVQTHISDHAVALQEIINHGNEGTVEHGQVLEIEGIIETFIQDESVTAEDVRMIAELSRTKGAASNNTFDLAKDFIKLFRVYAGKEATSFKDIEALVKTLPQDYIFPNPTRSYHFHATFSAYGVQINSLDLALAIQEHFLEMEVATINTRIIEWFENRTEVEITTAKIKTERNDENKSKLETKVEEQPKAGRK